MPVPNNRRLLAAGFLLAGLLACALPALLPRPSTPRYTVTDLGVLPGDTSSNASGINNRGEIVGFSGNDFSASHIFLVRGGRMTSAGPSMFLGGLAEPEINDSGKINRKQRLGSAAGPSGYERSLPHHAVLYSGSRKIDFTLPTGWLTANLCGVNGQGQVIGTCYRLIIGGRSRTSFVYDSKTRKFLMLLMPPGSQEEGFAEGINDHGQIAGSAWQVGNSQAMLWNAGQPVLLKGLPGMNDSKGEAVNNHGEVVGSAWSEPNAAAQYVNDHPLRWRLLVPTFQKQWKERAVVYKDGKMQDLNTLIPEDANWTLEEASSINDRGRIVGYGLHHGQERAFFLTPK